MQVLAVKPIARWQIWIGKWLGIVTLDAALLAMSGLCICCLLQWRATRLPPEERAVLRNEVLIARASLKEKSLDADIDKDTDQLLAERTQKIKLSDDERSRGAQATPRAGQSPIRSRAGGQTIVPGKSISSDCTRISSATSRCSCG